MSSWYNADLQKYLAELCDSGKCEHPEHRTNSK